eukprot:499336_1
MNVFKQSLPVVGGITDTFGCNAYDSCDLILHSMTTYYPSKGALSADIATQWDPSVVNVFKQSLQLMDYVGDGWDPGPPITPHFDHRLTPLFTQGIFNQCDDQLQGIALNAPDHYAICNVDPSRCFDLSMTGIRSAVIFRDYLNAVSYLLWMNRMLLNQMCNAIGTGWHLVMWFAKGLLYYKQYLSAVICSNRHAADCLWVLINALYQALQYELRLERCIYLLYVIRIILIHEMYFVYNEYVYDAI